MARKIVEPLKNIDISDSYAFREWLDRFRRNAAIVEKVTATIAVPVMAAGAVVVANVTVAGIDPEDVIIGHSYQYQAPLYLNVVWTTSDVWVYGADTVRITFWDRSGAGSGGVNSPYEFYVLKYKPVG